MVKRHHDLAALLTTMYADPSQHALRSIETMAVLALQIDKPGMTRELMAEHQAELDRRGSGLPAFAENRRWHNEMVALLHPAGRG